LRLVNPQAVRDKPSKIEKLQLEPVILILKTNGATLDQSMPSIRQSTKSTFKNDAPETFNPLRSLPEKEQFSNVVFTTTAEVMFIDVNSQE
jgi:hypothetical protein